MRKGFDGLTGLVTAHMNEDVMSGTVFIFINKRGDRIKLLRWEPGGLVIYYKRLESGRFKMPPPVEGCSKRMINYAELAMLIEGLSPVKTRQRKRYLHTSECL